MCQINKIKFMDRPTDKQIADVLAGIASVEEAKMVCYRGRKCIFGFGF